MKQERTTISVYPETWDVVNKERKIGENLNDVVFRVFTEFKKME